MRTHVVVLGAGFGGLEVSARLSEEFGDGIDIVLIDQSEGFVFGFSKLDVIFGRAPAHHVVHPYRDLAKPGLRFVSATVDSIDPSARRVTTSAGDFEADILVVALGADLDPEATPGLVEGGHEFYTVAGAFGLRDVLPAFGGGHVIVGVTSAPFKCPPAPSEMALLMHDYLISRGLRDTSTVSLVMPFGAPVPPSPEASEALLAAFADRGITWVPDNLVVSLDPVARTVLRSDGTTIPYDLFLGIPVHRAPRVVVESGMTVDGWIPVDPLTLETDYPGVYAIGDVTSVGTPKAGVFAEGQGAVVAGEIIAALRGSGNAVTYDGHGLCYLEFGHDMVAKVDVTFLRGQRPTGDLEGPSPGLVADKSDFGNVRIKRWFGREWRPTAQDADSIG